MPSRHAPRLLGVLALILLAGCKGARDAKWIDTARGIGRLAPLPAQASHVQVAAIDNLFNSSFWLRFEAPPEAIETFLATSPGLAGVTPEALCSFTEAWPFFDSSPAPLPGQARLFARANEGCEPRELSLPSSGQSWFDVASAGKGRLYVIPQDNEANGGTLVVDDAHHVVYVSVSHS